uniref:Uncharacterized protein n=1 Tax=Trichobilharzia regenti TaxID=157069 RepID=A0AA85K212_TRIRE|nr:unnamed protein product [Trichobilharzia regenti]
MMNCRHSFKIRCAHWLLARISLFQSICLLLWLGERAYHEIEPPIHPWAVYTYIGIGLVASTGITSRFFTRLSLASILLSQIYIAYIFGVEKRLGYSKCLRARVGLRCLTTIGIYFRLLGVNSMCDGNANTTDNTTNNHSSSSSSLLTSQLQSKPYKLFQLDEDIQLTEINSTWPLLLLADSYGCLKALSLILGLCMLTVGFIYSIPVIIHDQLVILNNNNNNNPNHKTFSYNSYLFRLADYLVVVCFLILSLLRDCNFSYWRVKGCEFWLEIRVLLENVTVLLGIFVIAHLTTTINQISSKKSGNKLSKTVRKNCKSTIRNDEKTNVKKD